MSNLFLGTGHTNVKKLSVEMLAATLDSLRDKFCPNAPSSRAYTHTSAPTFTASHWGARATGYPVWDGVKPCSTSQHYLSK